MSIFKLKEKSQITIPKELREKLNVKPGDYFDISEKDGKIVLTPQVITSKDNEVELSKEGYKNLDESLKDLKEGNIHVFESVDEFIDSLPD